MADTAGDFKRADRGGGVAMVVGGDHPVAADASAAHTLSDKARAILDTMDFPPMEVVSDCTPYDMVRPRRQLVHDDRTSTLLSRAFNFELICPVCLSLLNRPMAVMECMHRFCEECIEKSIRIGKKECPTCRVKCASRRSLRHDEALQEFIAKVYPNREEFEARQLQLPKSALVPFPLRPPPALGRARLAGRSRGRPAHRPAPRGRPASDSEPDRSDASVPEASSSPEQRHADASGDERRTVPTAAVASAADTRRTSGRKRAVPATGRGATSAAQRRNIQPRELDLVLLSHPADTRLPGLERPFLRTSSLITVGHLCKFLSTKLGRRAVQFQLTIETERGEVILDDHLTLGDMHEMIGPDETLVVQYRLRG